jgi:hypothetical protein
LLARRRYPIGRNDDLVEHERRTGDHQEVAQIAALACHTVCDRRLITKDMLGCLLETQGITIKAVGSFQIAPEDRDMIDQDGRVVGWHG